MLEQEGAFKKNPHRRLPPSPKSNQPIGDPPEYLNPAEQEIYRELVMDIPFGVVTAPDRSALGLLCILEHLKRNRTVKIGEMNMLARMYSLFGLTPSDRTRVTAQPNLEDNPFSEF